MDAAGADAVVVSVKVGEAEEFGGGYGAVEAWSGFLLGEGRGYRREGVVVTLVGEAPTIKFVADEGGLDLSEGVVAVVPGVGEGVGLAVAAAAELGVEVLIVPEDGLQVAGDAGVGFEGGDEVVEAGFEGREGVFRAEAAGSTMALEVEIRGEFRDLLQEVGAVGDEAVDA